MLFYTFIIIFGVYKNIVMDCLFFIIYYTVLPKSRKIVPILDDIIQDK